MLKKCTFLCLFSLFSFKTGITNYLPEPTPIFNLLAAASSIIRYGQFWWIKTQSFSCRNRSSFSKGRWRWSDFGCGPGIYISKVKIDCKNYGNSLYIQHLVRIHHGVCTPEQIQARCSGTRKGVSIQYTAERSWDWIWTGRICSQCRWFNRIYGKHRR